MKTQQDNRDKWLNLRLTGEEFELFKKQFQKSTFRKMSDYGRTVLLGRPVTLFYRDRSMDELLEELILLRREINSIGNNLNQAVKNINSAHSLTDAGTWMALLGIVRGKLEPAMEEIRGQIQQYAELWSQKLKTGKAL